MKESTKFGKMIGRKNVYINIVPFYYQDNPILWHVWKKFIWHKYSSILLFLVEYTFLIKKAGLELHFVELSTVIEKATGKNWDEIESIYEAAK